MTPWQGMIFGQRLAFRLLIKLAPPVVAGSLSSSYSLSLWERAGVRVCAPFLCCFQVVAHNHDQREKGYFTLSFAPSPLAPLPVGEGNAAAS